MTALFVALAVGSALTALFAVAAWAREHWLVVTVVGQSMVPTLVDGQRVLARRPQRGQRLAIGDVVVFALPESLARQARANRDVTYRVKRIVAVGGDPLPLPHALDRHSEAVGDWRILKRNARIPEGHFAVVGDAPGSEDSSHLGLVARRQILAWVPCLAYRDVRRRREPPWEEQEPAPLPREPVSDRMPVSTARKAPEPAAPSRELAARRARDRTSDEEREPLARPGTPSTHRTRDGTSDDEREPVAPPPEPSCHCANDSPGRGELPVEADEGRGALPAKTLPLGCIRLMTRRRGWRS